MSAALAFYQGLAATAERLIRDKGRTVYIQLLNDTTPTGYDPAEPEAFSGVAFVHEAKAVMLSYSEREINGRTILASDKKLIMSSSGAPLQRPPKPGDRIATDCETLAVVDVKSIEPGPLRVVYILQLRK